MKTPDVESGTKCLARLGPQFLDLEFAQLVGQRLARPNDVPVNLHDNIVLGFPGVGLEKIDRLLTRPALGMDAGVDHQSDGPPHLVGQLAKLGIGISVKTHLLAKALGVKSPALDVAGVTAVLAKFREPLDLVRDGQLQVMARHGLVQRERFHLPLGSRFEIVGVGEKISGPPGLVRTRLVVGGSHRLFNISRDRHHAVRLAG